MSYAPSGSSVYGDSSGKNTGVGCHALLQGIFPTQGSNLNLLHCRQILYCLSHHRSPKFSIYLFYEIDWTLLWPGTVLGTEDRAANKIVFNRASVSVGQWHRSLEFNSGKLFQWLEKEMATHSNVLAWRIPGTAEPGGLPSTGSHRVWHNWSNLAAAVAVH